MPEAEAPKPAMEKLKTAKTLDRWVEVFKTAFKGAAVDIHEGAVDAAALDRMSVKLPAIFVSALSSPGAADVGDDTLSAETIFSAYILTGGQHRDISGLNMSEVARILIKTTVSKIDGVGRAKQIAWQNILSAALAGKVVSLNAVAWRQQILLGDQSTEDGMFTGGLPWPDEVVPTEFYIETGGDTQPGDPNSPPAPDPEA
jgi:hypothetical protein